VWAFVVLFFEHINNSSYKETDTPQDIEKVSKVVNYEDFDGIHKVGVKMPC